MKLAPVTKVDKKNKATLKENVRDVCRKIVTWLLFFQFNADLDSGRIVYKTYIFINHHGAEISVNWLVEQSAIKLLILIRY